MPSTAGVTKYLPALLPEIKFSQSYLEQLYRLVQSKAILKQNGYIVDEISERDIERKKRCKKCGKYIQKGASKSKKETSNKSSENAPKSILADNLLLIDVDSPAHLEEQSPAKLNKPVKPKSEVSGTSSTVKKKETQEPVIRCRFHNGSLRRQFWSCCNQFKYSKGCQQAENHESHVYKKGELEDFWKYHPTPNPHNKSIHRYAVAIDCEMGINKNGDTELIRISAIDYFTSEVLIDNLVYPDIPMADYNTRYSGVSPQQMEAAYRKGLCFIGKKAAREAIWNFVGPKTIVVGHSANNDLTALRWIHESIIDTMLIDLLKFMKEQKQAELAEQKEKENISLLDAEIVDEISNEISKKKFLENTSHEEPKQKNRGSRNFSLKSLTLERIGKHIQQGRMGHDSLEDAIAARDLAHWNVINQRTKDITLI